MASQTTSSVATELIDAGLSKVDAEKLADDFDQIIATNSLSSEKWRQISKKLLTPQHPFKVHQYLFSQTYANSDEPNYIWIPSQQEIEETNLQKYIKSQNLKDLNELLIWADNNREEFWQSIVKTLNIKFDENENKNNDNRIFDLSKGVENAIYFPNKKMNASDLILTGDDNRIVITWSKEGKNDNNGNPILNNITLKQLKQCVTNIAYALTNTLKLVPGDAVGIDMPMNWESVAVYLGIIKAGMAVVSIADSFAPKEIEVRLKISSCKVVFTQDVIARGVKRIPLYERVIAANALQCVVVSESDDNNLQCSLRDNDISWEDFLSDTSDQTIFNTVLCDSMDVANILFSSGTTGDPKAIPWHHSTFIKPFADGYLHNDVRSGEVVAWPTNVGWMMGPWLIAQIGLNASIALFVGSPVNKSFCKFVEIANISHLGVIPSMVKAWMRLDSTSSCDWKCVRRYSSTGEASNPTLYHWLVSRSYYTPVMEYVGGTEIAGGYLGGTMIQPQILSSFSCPCIGLNIHLLDVNGNILNNNKINARGELTISPPSCGLSVKLLNRNHNEVYYGGMPKNVKDVNYNNKIRTILRRHGDTLRIVAHTKYGNYYQHLGRMDDTMNLGGIKVSSVALENVILKHPLLSREVAAIAYRESDIDTDQLIVCGVPKLKDDLFAIEFKKKPFQISLAPAKINDKLTIVYSVDNKERYRDYNNLLQQPVIYRINNIMVYNRVSFTDVINIISKTNINDKNPMKIYFLRQRFNLQNVQKELQILIKKEQNPLFRVNDLYLISTLPRTASGKVMRRILRNNYEDLKKKVQP